MKRMMMMMAMTIVMLTGSTVFAQNGEKAKNGERQRMTREQMAQAQARHIAREIALDDATSQKFVETYSACQKEIWALRPKGERGKKLQNMTEAETEQHIKNRFAQNQKILDIREKYYKEYSKFLTQKQIERVYDLEKKSMKRLAKHGARNKKMGNHRNKK